MALVSWAMMAAMVLLLARVPCPLDKQVLAREQTETDWCWVGGGLGGFYHLGRNTTNQIWGNNLPAEYVNKRNKLGLCGVNLSLS